MEKRMIHPLILMLVVSAFSLPVTATESSLPPVRYQLSADDKIQTINLGLFNSSRKLQLDQPSYAFLTFIQEFDDLKLSRSEREKTLNLKVNRASSDSINVSPFSSKRRLFLEELVRTDSNHTEHHKTAFSDVQEYLNNHQKTLQNMAIVPSNVIKISKKHWLF